MTTEPFGNAKSPSLDAELALADSETTSDEVVTPVNKEKDASNRELTKINTGVQDEGQAGLNPEKTNAESEVQSMVMVPIHQDTSSVPPMTTPVNDLTTSQPDSLTILAPLPTSTATTAVVTTTTTLPPPPLQPQQSTTNPILL
ncbi:hypothetical protein Tco_1493100 [Tanacetum coccineum]